MECPNPVMTKAQRFAVMPALKLLDFMSLLLHQGAISCRHSGQIHFADGCTLIGGYDQLIIYCWDRPCYVAFSISPLTPQLFFAKPG